MSSHARFKYTVDDPQSKLTVEQREQYEREGFVVIRRLIPPHDIERYRKRFDAISSGLVKIPGLTVMRDIKLATQGVTRSERTITKLQDYQLDDEMFDYCCHPAIVKYVRGFIGPDVNAMHTMLINKPPDPGTQTSRHPMHQDLHYFPFRPADRIVCSWTAMQPITRHNGCLVVVPGTHTGRLLPHDYPKWKGGVNKMYHGIVDYDTGTEYIHLPMDTGDTVFFHPILIHGSGTNRSEGFRKAISCHYSTTNCDWIDVTGTSQGNIAEEAKEVARFKYGNDVADSLKYEDIWKLKSRIVCGKEAKL